MDNLEYKDTNDSVSLMLREELKNHYAKRENMGIVSVGVVNEHVDYVDKCKLNNNSSEENNLDNIDKFKRKHITRFIVRSICAACILACVYYRKYIPENKYVDYIKKWYRKDYTIESTIESCEELSKKCYSKINKYIPEEIYNKTVETYINNIKPRIINFSVENVIATPEIENTVTVFNESENMIIDPDMVIAKEDVSTSSEISLMDMDVSEILSKNIKIELPATGTVTSIYGAREEVFKDVGYHTGVDIANALNTPVCSATSGKVVLCQSMDKYYGNNIEIENNGVIFKYAHLNKILVSEGDDVSIGDKIGLMGSTGASTGSHLHFEIRINGRSVDPELLIKVR